MHGDAIILGGGTAGAAVALGLALAGARPILIEATATTPWRVGETLGPGARPELLRLGVWETHLQSNHLPCHGTVSAWGSPALAAQDHVFNPHGNAWQLDRQVFESHMLQAAQQAGALIFRGHAAEMARAGELWTVQAGPVACSAPWMVDATGRRAAVGRHVGVQRETLDDLVALHTLVDAPDPADRDSRIFLETEADGWWYTSLLPGGRRVLSYQTDPALLPAEQAWREPPWWLGKFSRLRHLPALFMKHGIVLKNAPKLTSAHSGRLEQFGGPGWLAVGDAAMSFDPISGHGLLKALRSAALVAECLIRRPSQAVEECSAAHEELWQAYVKSRQFYYAAEDRWPDAPFWKSRHADVFIPT